MASLGTLLLLASFVACSYAAVISVVGARRGSRALIESGIGAFYLIAALMTAATAVIVNAFISGDYSIKYVAHYSDSVQPLFYKITAYWGGLDGSIMFWVFLLSLFGSAAVYVNRERHRELIPYVVAVISTVQMFFLYLMVVHKNPFTTFLATAPADGEGLNPLLQNYWMVIHPPSLYTGFVGMTIPFAFGIAALITGHLDDSWLRAVRRWTMVSWLFLSLGLTLGMIWAYEELGWGGYWEWDPVENAALLPWFTATAFLHSVMVQERRSMLRVWNITLVITTFFLTIFGTFMTRSGVVQSVHAFGDDPILARMFVIFMVAILTFSFGLVIYRLPLLRARNELDSWMSREAAFLVNNWILLFCALFVLFATMFPTLSEAVTGHRLTVAAPFYNKWMAPVGIVMLFLTGVGPLLAWRKSTFSNARHQFMWPVLCGVGTGTALAVLGLRLWPSGLCFALCAFVTGTIAQEFIRGGIVRKKNTGTDILTAIIGLVGRNRRRYGGYIVHLGIVLMFLGFAGNSYKKDTQLVLKLGEQTTLGRYTLRNDGVKVSDDGQKQMVTGYISVFEKGKQVDTMYPARWFFRKHESEPTTEVAIRRSLVEDLYVVLAFDRQNLGSQSATLQVVINPLVDWIWLGFAVMALGTGIALLPERSYSFALAKLGAEAMGTTAATLLLIVALAGTTAFAQHEGGGGDSVQNSFYARTDFEKQMQHEIVCTCGSCGHASIGECRKDPCGTSHKMRGELAAFIDQGKSHDEIIQAFVKLYNSEEMLGAPIDQGFSRLAWMFPYLLGTGGAVAVGLVAVKWSRHPLPQVSDAKPPPILISKNASTMSSETSTDAVRLETETTAGADRSTLEPWQFFVLAALGCATAALFATRGQSVSSIVLLTVLMGAAALVGLAALRMLRPLVTAEEDRTAMIGERTRAALEREKMLSLRAIKELEFDRAMGKLSESDWQEMSTRLRARAGRLMRQLDAGVGYRDRIERDLAARLGAFPAASPAVATLADAALCGTCRTKNDADAKFCKSCGTKLSE